MHTYKGSSCPKLRERIHYTPASNIHLIHSGPIAQPTYVNSFLHFFTIVLVNIRKTVFSIEGVECQPKWIIMI